MDEILKGILALSGELKEIKVHLQYLKKTRTEIFKESWIDGQDVMLEDVERIEVVRGPGGTLWGANAVNGIINIYPKVNR